MSDLNREEIIKLSRNASCVLVWITEKGAVLQIPGHGLSLIEKVTAAFFDDPDLRLPEISLVLIEGTTGISATDPFWDGSDIFTCENPQCSCFGKSENMDDHVHNNLWLHISGRRMKNRAKAKRKSLKAKKASQKN